MMIDSERITPEGTPEGEIETPKINWGRRFRLGALATSLAISVALIVGMKHEAGETSAALDKMEQYEAEYPFLRTLDTQEEIDALTPNARTVYDHNQELLDDFLGHAETASHYGVAMVPTMLLFMVVAVPNMYNGAKDLDGVVDWWAARRLGEPASH